MKTTKQNRADNCTALEAYFTERCISAASIGLSALASHYARRALLAANMARFHSETSDGGKIFAFEMMARTIQHHARMRRYTI